MIAPGMQPVSCAPVRGLRGEGGRLTQGCARTSLHPGLEPGRPVRGCISRPGPPLQMKTWSGATDGDPVRGCIWRLVNRVAPQHMASRTRRRPSDLESVKSFWSFGFVSSAFVSNFVLRISDLVAATPRWAKLESRHPGLHRLPAHVAARGA